MPVKACFVLFADEDKLSLWIVIFRPRREPWKDCCCSSAVERFLGKDEVMGSNPISSFSE